MSSVELYFKIKNYRCFGFVSLSSLTKYILFITNRQCFEVGYTYICVSLPVSGTHILLFKDFSS